MVLPILVPSNDWTWARSAVPDRVAKPKHKPKRAQRARRYAPRFASEQEAVTLRLSHRLPHTAKKYWPRVMVKPADARQDGQDAVELASRCELLATCLLRRWRKIGGVRSAQVQRLARSYDDAGCIQSQPGDIPALAWMLQAMYWRGASHPWALTHERLHPATGVMRWLSMFPIQTQCEQPQWIALHLHASMTAFKHRALAVAKLLMRVSQHGRLMLRPELLKDQYWGIDVNSQNYAVKRQGINNLRSSLTSGGS